MFTGNNGCSGSISFFSKVFGMIRFYTIFLHKNGPVSLSLYLPFLLFLIRNSVGCNYMTPVGPVIWFDYSFHQIIITFLISSSVSYPPRLNNQIIFPPLHCPLIFQETVISPPAFKKAPGSPINLVAPMCSEDSQKSQLYLHLQIPFLLSPSPIRNVSPRFSYFFFHLWILIPYLPPLFDYLFCVCLFPDQEDICVMDDFLICIVSHADFHVVDLSSHPVCTD